MSDNTYQQSSLPPRSAPGGGAQEASVSDDARASTEHMARLMVAAQQKINSGRHGNQIGADPS